VRLPPHRMASDPTRAAAGDDLAGEQGSSQPE